MQKFKVLLLFFALLTQIGCPSNSLDPISTLPDPGYAVVMDAGSSGTRVYVYKVESRGDLSPQVTKIASCKDQPASGTVPTPGCQGQSKDRGIAALASASLTQAQMDSYLKPMIYFARAQIPSTADLSHVPVFLRATAGVRNLNDSKLRVQLLNYATETLNRSGFESKQAKTISGEFEGIFAWVNANDILGNLGKSPELTRGIVEIGGASEQITFISADQPTDFPIEINGEFYSFYTYSYAHLGVNEALAVSLPACDTPQLAGTFNYTECKNAWIRQLDENRFCDPLCGLGGVSQPPIAETFILLGATATGIANGCNIKPLEPATIDRIGEQFCSTPPTSVSPTYVPSAEQLAICPKLGAAFFRQQCKVFALLSAELAGSGSRTLFTGFGFDPEAKIEAPDENGNINGQEATWTKGFVILYMLGLIPGV